MKKNSLTLKSVAVYLLAVDLLFITLHLLLMVFHHADQSNPLSLQADRGFSELFQYAKELFIVIALYRCALQMQSKAYLSWAALFLFLFLDDSLSIHEGLGHWIGGAFLEQFGQTLPDGVGELTVAAGFGIPLLSGIAFSFLRGDSYFQKVSLYLGALVGILIFFGVILDFATHYIHIHSKVTLLLSVIEDGGELIAMSLITLYSIHLQQVSKAIQHQQ